MDHPLLRRVSETRYRNTEIEDELNVLAEPESSPIAAPKGPSPSTNGPTTHAAPTPTTRPSMAGAPPSGGVAAMMGKVWREGRKKEVVVGIVEYFSCFDWFESELT